MCDHSEIEASEVTDGNISWDPLSSDSDVKAIVEKMKTLDTGKVIGEGAKTVTDEGNEESKDKEAEEVGKDKDVGDGKMEVEKVKEEEEPDFGVEDDNEVEFQKVVETDKDVASDAIIPLKPRKDLMSVAPDASDVDGAASFALPSAKARARSIPPVSRSKSKPRAKSLARTRSRTREAIKDVGDRGRSPPSRPATQKGPRLMVSSGGSFSKCSSIVSTMPKSKASILRDLSKLELDGHAMINVHVAGYFYVPTIRWPVTHPRQLAACVLRGDGMQEERWACWSCQIPVDPNYPHRTGKVTFSTAKEQCYHWWLNHASPTQWDFYYDCEAFGVTHEEIMLAVGIDLKTCPLPIGTALERIPKILPSHEAGHDPLLRGEPWFRKVAFPTIPSERNVPWAGNTWRHAPHPPAGPPPDHVKNASSSKGYPLGDGDAKGSGKGSDGKTSSKDYPPKSDLVKIDEKKAKENLSRNREIVSELRAAGVPCIPGGEFYSDSVLSSLGWIDPLDIFYDAMVEEIRVICRGESSVGDYGQQRRLLHAATFGRSDVAMTLLRMEEHAFYLVVIKLTASVAMAFPERLSPEQRVLSSTLLAFCPNALDRCMELAKKDFATLQYQDQVNLVLGYCRVVCQASMPMWTGGVPSPPELTVPQGMSRSQMAALLM